MFKCSPPSLFMKKQSPTFPGVPWLFQRAPLGVARSRGGQRALLLESPSWPEPSSVWVVGVSADRGSEGVKATTQDFGSLLTLLTELRSQRGEGTCTPHQKNQPLLEALKGWAAGQGLHAALKGAQITRSDAATFLGVGVAKGPRPHSH